MLREWKDGVPRGAYHGIVTIRFQSARIFIAPSPNFRPTDPDADHTTGVTDSTGALIRKRDRHAAMGMRKARGGVPP